MSYLNEMEKHGKRVNKKGSIILHMLVNSLIVYIRKIGFEDE